MKKAIRIILYSFSLIMVISTNAQKIQINGKLSGKIASAVKEIQFICDGKVQSLIVSKTDGSFSGNLKIKEPQFVEIKSGNPKSQFYYLIPGQSLKIIIDKPSLQESIVTIDNPKVNQLQQIFDSYSLGLKEKGVDDKIRDWQQMLFIDNSALDNAELKLKEQLSKNAKIVAEIPNFYSDLNLFMSGFRNYTLVDKMSLLEIEKALQKLKEAHLKSTALNIPFYKEYLTDLTNAYAARTLEKYSISIDYVKQKNTSQFIAAEAINKYISDSSIKSNLYSEKLKVEIPTNGLKNESYVAFLLDNSNQYVKDFYKEKLELLKANKIPDLNSARKRAFEFVLQDENGKEYKLDDFKGKMLFIDFWASWCAPCKAQIPYQKELEKAYLGKDVVFMSVSLDKSKEAWIKAVKEEDLHGYVLHAEGDFKNAFPKAYAIESIPRYILIDVNGNIISDNMMKPQNKKEIKAIFDEELYAKNTNSILEKHFLAIGAQNLLAKGLEMDYRQSVVSFNAQNKLQFSYPDKLKLTNRFEETDQMVMMLGKSFFDEKYTIINADKIATNNPSMSNAKSNWVNKVFGFELFLRKTINNSVIKFADDNISNTDSAYVLKLMHNGVEERYYINKTTYLIDKYTILTTNLEPRKGGGYMETFVKYEDYKDIGGVKIPFRINQSNIISMKVEKATLKTISPEIFKF